MGYKCLSVYNPLLMPLISFFDFSTFHEGYPGLIAKYFIPNTPPLPLPKTAVFTREWFKSYIPRPNVPQALRFPFPFSILIYALLPLLIPVIMLLVFSRFAIKTQSSRLRIKLLEKESWKRKQKVLLHVLAEIEQGVEEAVADLIDGSDPVPIYQRSSNHPVIGTNHRKIATWLNALAIHKEFAYFEDVANSHAMIVCRDIQTVDSHRLGVPVVKHWADHLVI